MVLKPESLKTNTTTQNCLSQAPKNGDKTSKGQNDERTKRRKEKNEKKQDF